MDNNLVREGYNKAAEDYSAKRDPFKNEPYLERLVKLLKPGAKILDIGCGAGVPIDQYLVERDFKVKGLDISEKQIELARKNVPEANFEVKDMSALKEGEYQVDGVVSFYAIFHIDRKEHGALLNKIASFLPMGGYLLITMGSRDWEGSEEFHGAQMYWSHYGAEKNLELVQEAGFEIIFNEIDTSGNEKHLVILGKKK